MILIILLFVATVCACCPDGVLVENKFEVTNGCQQLNANIGYNTYNSYYPLSQFRNVRSVNGTIKMRMGVLGDRNAYIRLAPIQRPYDSTRMHEIVISHTIDSESFLQSYVRTATNKFNKHISFKKQYTKGWMSWSEPMMFTVEVTSKGRVTVTREKGNLVFIDEIDNPVSTNYIGFVNWATNERVIFFVDCPL